MSFLSSLGAGADAAGLNSATVGTLGKVGSTPLLSSGPASALSGFNDAIADAVKPVASILQGITGATGLPLANILSNYATYNYIIGLGVLPIDDYNNHTYMSGKQIPLVCKSGHVDPNNRPNTSYGKFDYYIDNLSLTTAMSAYSGINANVTTVTFDIIEPYSMGMFMLALQTAALEAGYENWSDAPYILSIEFRGNTETGQLLDIPNTKRFIPIKLGTMNIKAKESGTMYLCTAAASNAQALTEQYVNVPSDISIKGETVQQALQTGEKSLQAIINQRLKQFKDDKLVNVPDEIVILFPKVVDSASSATPSGESTATATSTPTSGGDFRTKLGLKQSDINNTLVQAEGECNEFGSASLGFDSTRKADTPMSDDDKVYNNGVWVRGNASINVKENNFKFAQESTIINAIDQVIMASQYPELALKPDALDGLGRRKWWKVDPQVYYKDSNENITKTGRKPRVVVYRVIPNNVHSSIMPAANAKAPGIDEIAKTVVKRYDYIYTGKNTEIIRFDIDLNNSFAMRVHADNYKRSQDIRTQSETSIESLFDFPNFAKTLFKSFTEGLMPSSTPGTIPTAVRHDSVGSPSDRMGGGGAETEATRAARSFQEALVNPATMMTINLEIQGDPFWFVQSGQGTYTATSSGIKNLNADGSVECQVDEVDILVVFRTPVDINQGTGMYNFGGSSETAPVNQFSGVYRVNVVTSYFRQGRFTQELTANRRMNQENKEQGSGLNIFNVHDN